MARGILTKDRRGLIREIHLWQRKLHRARVPVWVAYCRQQIAARLIRLRAVL